MSINKMPFNEKCIHFAASIGFPDSNSVSFLYRFSVKPIEFMRGDDGTPKATQFFWREIVSRIWGLAASAFAAITAVYHILASLVKTIPASLRSSGVKQIPETFSFRAIRDNLKNAGQAIALTPVASLIGVIRPDKLKDLAYPISEKNKTAIFGYHEVSNTLTDAWTVSPNMFKIHLEHLYKYNYELCTVAEFTNGHKPRKGKKLAIITFDDSHESQFRMIKSDGGKVVIDPSCAMGVLEEFKKEHPDFRCTATFYVNTCKEPGPSQEKKHTLFADKEDQIQHTKCKLEFLKDNGYEIGSHGHRHFRFNKLSYEEIKNDIQQFDESIRDVGFDPSEITSFAWPYGLSPKDKRRTLINNRFKTVADFGFNSGKVDRKQMNKKYMKRIFIGPNTGFSQYVP